MGPLCVAEFPEDTKFTMVEKSLAIVLNHYLMTLYYHYVTGPATQLCVMDGVFVYTGV